MPRWLPRLGRIRARPALRFFEEVVGELIDDAASAARRGEAAPRDILTLLLEAADPETGRGLTDLEVRANIVTFIGAGHETTANALSWSLYLLSQAPRGARARRGGGRRSRSGSGLADAEDARPPRLHPRP